MGESMGGAIALDLAARAERRRRLPAPSCSPPPFGAAPSRDFVLASALWVANGVAPGYRITAGDVPVRVHAPATTGTPCSPWPTTR